MAVVVQKFGGTSINSGEGRSALIRHVKRCKAEGDDVIVVVSAMGRKGEPYATDSLLNILYQAGNTIDPKKKDLIMSCGEVIACALIGHLLDINGICAESLSGCQAGIRTDSNYNNSEIISIDTSIIQNHIKQGKTLVIAGFQGTTDKGEITTLGRGGSDTTAAAIGGYLNAKRVDIFTDVPGVAVVDPRIVSKVQYLDHISYRDMYKLASHGAKVLHPRAVETAEKYQVPVRVLSTFEDSPGTLITSDAILEDQKIIGISLEKEVYNEGIGRISIFYNKNYQSEIIRVLSEHLKELNYSHVEMILEDDYSSILVPTEMMKACVESIYSLFYDFA